MATIYVDLEGSASGPLAEQRRLEARLRALQDCGWQHLAPLAQHMATKRLVRARGDTGAPLRHLDLEVLREALSRLLYREWEVGFLIVRLLVEGQEPAEVAAQRGVSGAMLVEELRQAVAMLASMYEAVASGSPGQSHAEQVRARLAGQRQQG